MNQPFRTDAGTADPYIDGVTDLEPVGQGGFGTVMRGRQVEFNRVVAIKVLYGHGSDADADRRFRREVAAMGAVSHHPNVVPVYATGVAADGRPYLVMPYLPGGTLADRLGTMSWQAVVDLGAKMAGALQAAHDVGVLHRDVKPANILWSAWDEPQLADFGIARLHDATRTTPGSVAASLWWAAPEALEGRPASPASDVYSLAASLHAAVTGRSPHNLGREEPMAATVARIASDTPEDLAGHGVPRRVADVIASGLAKDPAARPPSARAFGEALVEAAVLEPSRDRDPTPVPAVVPLPVPEPPTLDRSPAPAGGPPPPTDQGGTDAGPAVPEPPPANDLDAAHDREPPPVTLVDVPAVPSSAAASDPGPGTTVAAPVAAAGAATDAGPWAPPGVPRRAPAHAQRRRRVPLALVALAGLVAVAALALLGRALLADDGDDRPSARQATSTTTPATSPSTFSPSTAAGGGRPASPVTPSTARPSTSRPATTASPTTPAPTTTAAPATTATTAPPAPPTSAPAPGNAAPPASSAEPSAALASYYGLVSRGAYDTTWARLTPSYQSRIGGYGRYTSFWRDYPSVEVTNVRVEGPRAATATLRYRRSDGVVITESGRFRFTEGPSGALLIDAYDVG